MVMTKTSKANMTWVGLTMAAILLTGAGTTFAQSDDVTFSRDIVPILQQNCQECHRQGQMGPMSLMTYDEVRPWAPVIRTKVLERVMPPWHLDKTVGIQEFENDRSLTDAEIDTIVRWVDAGAPPGNLDQLPVAIDWPDDETWRMAERYGREPDLIVRSTWWTQSAQGQDQWWTPIIDTGLTEDRWVTGMEVRPTLVCRGLVSTAGGGAR